MDAASREADQGGVALVLLSGSLAVVVGAADRVMQGAERGDEVCALELFAPGSAEVLAAD